MKIYYEYLNFELQIEYKHNCAFNNGHIIEPILIFCGVWHKIIYIQTYFETIEDIEMQA